MLSEDFFLAEFPQCLPLKPYRRHKSFFRFSLDGFSLNAFTAHATGQQPSFDTCGEAAVGNLTVFIGPSTPNGVAAIDYGIFAASEQIAVWGTKFYSSQNLHNLFQKQILFFTLVVAYCVLGQVWLR